MGWGIEKKLLSPVATRSLAVSDRNVSSPASTAGGLEAGTVPATAAGKG